MTKKKNMIGKITSTSDLLQLAKKNGLLLKPEWVICKDQLEDLKKEQNMNIIINMDSINSVLYQGGTHWTAIFKRGPLILYFDSFGMAPDKLIINWCKVGSLGYNSFQIQELHSNNCGRYCLMFLIALDNGMDYEEFINQFNTKDNDKLINLK